MIFNAESEPIRVAIRARSGDLRLDASGQQYDRGSAVEQSEDRTARHLPHEGPIGRPICALD